MTHSDSILSISAPPFIYLPDVCCWFTARQGNLCHSIPVTGLQLRCWHAHLPQGWGGENGWGGETKIGVRETRRRVDSGDRKRKKSMSEIKREHVVVQRAKGGGGGLLLFPARSADCGWFQDGLSFSRDTTTAPKAGTGGKEETSAKNSTECWDSYKTTNPTHHNSF